MEIPLPPGKSSVKAKCGTCATSPPNKTLGREKLPSAGLGPVTVYTMPIRELALGGIIAIARGLGVQIDLDLFRCSL